MHTPWTDFREQMPVTQNWAYFDHAAVAPLCGPARSAISTWLVEASEQGDTCWPQWEQTAQQTRQTAAAMLGADAAEIAITPNTTAGLALVAEGFPWQSGDNVVTLENEFPSNLYPWMNLARQGVEARTVAVEQGRADVQRILDACDDRTRLISVSWVGYASGWRFTSADLRALVDGAHRRGALFLLDAIQGLGVFPLDVRQTGIDFLAADGHKWMLGPEGAGLFYLRREHLETLRPLGVGWNSVRQSHDFGRVELNLRETAERYEGGTRNMSGAIGLGASLQLLAGKGLTPQASPVAERVLELADDAHQRLTAAGAEMLSPHDGEHRSGILTFRLGDEDPAAQRRRCLDQGVVLSCRGGGLRISPHAYNNAADLDRLLAALQQPAS
ncbi:aminotransferase class V-fold PLP-dependent enzyme [Lignipirellula cremea]|uniref:Putative cysteine desulfurase n=1 Tax=Lignipirellula cremea TaxID=2528010 RepID=A0A518E2Y4_9BACT|nr:aminotransferase class V-fold PLP-dependent enzyme [Lignipirellula cremea]QDU98455.1 putative cysteine desulfurase [Lignipirellula cremea]